MGDAPVFAGSGPLTTVGAPARVGFRSFSRAIQNVYLDNALLAEGIVGPGVSETPPNILVQP